MRLSCEINELSLYLYDDVTNCTILAVYGSTYINHFPENGLY